MEAKELRIGNLFQTRGGKTRTIDLKELARVQRMPQLYKGIPLTEDWLLKFGFEDWGLGTRWNNEHENYTRYVLHNVLDGTSNFEVHYVYSNYGGVDHYQFIISCDEDDRLNWGVDIKHVHQLQNLYYALTQTELK